MISAESPWRRTIKCELSKQGKPLIKVVVGQAGAPNPKLIMGYFLVDTGATATCVDAAWIANLQLKSVGSAGLLTVSKSKATTCKLFEIGIFIPDAQTPVSGGAMGAGFAVHSLQVRATDLAAQRVDGLLGRDVLSRCELLYSGPTRTFSLSY